MSVQEFKCPCCGAPLKWGEGEQKMKCAYCDNIFDAETIEEYADEQASAPEDRIEWDEYSSSGELSEGVAFYVCNSCGGNITVGDTAAASSCPYCDSPVVIDSSVSGTLKPDVIIPFKLGKDKAMSAMRGFCKGKLLLPSDYISESRLEEVKGVYVPFWLFDCSADAKACYDATRVKRWKEGNTEYTKTDHFMVIREGSADFECVPVDGSSTIDDDYMEAIEPFDMADGVDFKTAYLSGFLADRYDIDSEGAQPRANARVSGGMAQLLRGTVSGYASVVQQNKSVHVSGGKIRYAMLPVWILSTKYKGTIYRFAMNAQTGKFAGELPISKRKTAAVFAAVTAGVTVIGSIISLFL